MNNTNTKSWKKIRLSQYVHKTDGCLTLLSLFVLGIVAALLHLYMRVRGLSIPGHHGLELMTILLFGRMQSRYYWSAVVIAFGALTVFLSHTIFMPFGQTIKPAVFFLANAFILDCLFNVLPKKLPIIIKGMLFGGISSIVKPVIYIPIVIYLDVSFGSITKHGFFIPILTHFIFGSIGAICGITLANSVTNKMVTNSNE